MIRRAILTSTAGFSLAFGAAGAVLAQETPPPVYWSQDADEEEVDLSGDGEVASEEDFSNLDQDEILAELQAEIDAELGGIMDLFEVAPLTEEQEALLPLAEQMTGHILPEGTFGTIMSDAMDPLMTTIMGAITSNPRIRLSAVTGVDSYDLEELGDDEAQEALDIFDPGFEARTEQMTGMITEMMRRLFDALEPAYRDGMTRALTSRFDEAEMREALTILETPVGAKLAQQSFIVQYDPQMLGVMEQMGPALMQVMPGMMEDFGHLDAALEDDGRRFTELSAAERERAARLLGKSETELEALTPDAVEAADEDELTDAVT